MKSRILRKWVNLSRPSKKYSYKTKDGVYRIIGELTPKQTWLLYYKHRDDYYTFLARRMKEDMAQYEED